jgi:hypothetical protein
VTGLLVLGHERLTLPRFVKISDELRCGLDPLNVVHKYTVFGEASEFIGCRANVVPCIRVGWEKVETHHDAFILIVKVY